MGKKCIFSLCKNRQLKKINGKEHIQFHSFPLRRPDILNKWLLAMKQEHWAPTAAARLCSDHFTPDCYKPTLGPRKLLLPDAIPSIFNFGKIPRKNLSKHNDNKLRKRKKHLLKGEEVYEQDAVGDLQLEPQIDHVDQPVQETETTNKILVEEQLKQNTETKVVLAEDQSKQDSEVTNEGIPFEFCGVDIDSQAEIINDQCSDVLTEAILDIEDFDINCPSAGESKEDDDLALSEVLKEDVSSSSENVLTEVNNQLSSKCRALHRRHLSTDNVADLKLRNTLKVFESLRISNKTQQRAMRRKIKILQLRIKRRDKRIQQLKSLVAELKNKIKGFAKGEDLFTGLEGFPHELLLHAFRNKDMKRNAIRYSPLMKEFALTLYCYSTRAYEYVRSVLIYLPNPSLIKKWIAVLNKPPLIEEQNEIQLIDNIEIIDDIREELIIDNINDFIVIETRPNEEPIS